MIENWEKQSIMGEGHYSVLSIDINNNLEIKPTKTAIEEEKNLLSLNEEDFLWTILEDHILNSDLCIASGEYACCSKPLIGWEPLYKDGDQDDVSCDHTHLWAFKEYVYFLASELFFKNKLVFSFVKDENQRCKKCVFYSFDQNLRCAVNPAGNPEDCTEYKSLTKGFESKI